MRPKVIFNYAPELSPLSKRTAEARLERLGDRISKLVAKLASTRGATVDFGNVIWLPVEIGLGSSAPFVSIEIEMIGLPALKAKLADGSAVMRLKKTILAIHKFPTWPPDQPLISIKYGDPDNLLV
jgi:hypothetical protein